MPDNQNTELNEFKEKEVLVQFKLMDGEELQGRIDWYDNFNINITVSNKKSIESMTIPKHAIVYYYPL